MATNKFKSKVSTNLIDGAVPVDDAGTPTPSEEVTMIEPVEETVDAGENPETAPPVKIVEEEEVTIKDIPERNVKVCLKANHSCSIGGTMYHFEKGKQYNVPISVKEILLQSDLLAPL